MISSPGIGSGLDVNNIVDRLVALERRPLQRLGQERQGLEAQISAFGALQAAFTSFQGAIEDIATPAAFRLFSTASTDEAVVTATAGGDAARGTFNVDVQRLAENHRLAAGTTYADTDATTLGADGDTMTLTVGGEAFTVEIGGRTLAEVRDAINGAADNTGVTASVLKDDVGFRLTLAANDTGSGGFVGVDYSGSDVFDLATLNADRDGSAGFTPADLDAVIELENQFTVTSESNTVTGAVGGVTLNLAGTGQARVDIDRDEAAVTSAVRGFVDAYNNIVDAMDKAGSEALRSERASLVAIESQLRNVLNTETPGAEPFELLFEIGVSTTQSGRLELDEQVLDSAMSSDFEAVVALFTSAQGGVAGRFDEVAASLVGVGGLLDARTESLNRRVDAIEDRALTLEARVASVEERLLAQFGALDQLVSELNTTGEFLDRQLGQLADIGGGA